MAKPLTDSLIAALRPARGQATWREIVDGGARGLTLRVSPRGEKVWAVRHSVGGRRTRHTVGAYPSVTLAEARRRCAEYLAAAREGMGADEANARQRAAKMTVEHAHAAYMEGVGPFLRERTRKQKATLFEQHIKPVLGSRLIRVVRRPDVVEMVESIRKKYAVQANRAYSEVMAMLRWCEQRGYLTGVPTVRKKEVATRERPRRRTLTDAEVGAVWQASEGLGRTTRDFLRLLILTGQRRDEVRLMRWEEVNLAQGLWTIPSTRYKTRVDHAVPLSPTACGILAALRTGGATGFVLCGRQDPNKPFNGAASAMRRLRQVVPSNPPFVLHDFRRTLRTGLARLGIDDETAELVLGHVPQGVRKIYDLYDRFDERRAALSRWAEFVIAAVSSPAAMVLSVREHLEASRAA